MQAQTGSDNSDKTVVIAENATIINGETGNGKPCKLADNTNSVNEHELAQLLDSLINNQTFGIHAMSGSDGIISLDKPKLSHIQIDDELYRLYLFRYHAIIEKF